MSAPDDLLVTAHQLLTNQKFGTLATQSLKRPGFPYCSVMPYAVSPTGALLFLISSLATHTRNLKTNPNASILVTEPSSTPLKVGRVTLLGKTERVEDSEQEMVQSIYKKAHPNSQQWGGFHDFRFYQLTVMDVYVVAGFGSMGWRNSEDYSAQYTK